MIKSKIIFRSATSTKLNGLFPVHMRIIVEYIHDLIIYKIIDYIKMSLE